MVRLWQVTENDNQMRIYWFETKKEADSCAKEYQRNRESDAEAFNGSVDVEAIEFPASRKGLVKAMNWALSLTCFNEG